MGMEAERAVVMDEVVDLQMRTLCSFHTHDLKEVSVCKITKPALR